MSVTYTATTASTALCVGAILQLVVVKPFLAAANSI